MITKTDAERFDLSVWCQICLRNRVYTAGCDHIRLPERIARDRERLIDEARD